MTVDIKDIKQVNISVDEDLFIEFKKLMIDEGTTVTKCVTEHIQDVVDESNRKKNLKIDSNETYAKSISLKNVDIQNDEICLAAVKSDGLNLRYVKKAN